MENGFHGAKAAVFIGAWLLIYQRDRGVVWPVYWDFPGGGREGEETRRACLRREVLEEFALDVPIGAITWGRAISSMLSPTAEAWFFIVYLPAEIEESICFGDEGQRWTLMDIDDVMNILNLAPALRARLRLWLQDTDTDLI